MPSRVRFFLRLIAALGLLATLASPASAVYCVGDSIAQGVCGSIGAQGTTQVGANESQVLAEINSAAASGALNGQQIILSSGASNDPSQAGMLQQELNALQADGVSMSNVTVIGVGNRSDFSGVNSQLQTIAQQDGASFTAIDPNTLGADGVHPKDPSAYSALASAAEANLGGNASNNNGGNNGSNNNGGNNGGNNGAGGGNAACTASASTSCTYDQPSGGSDSGGLVNQGETQIVQMICKAHLTIYKMVGQINCIGDVTSSSSAWAQIAMGIAAKIFAFVAILMFSYALIVIALQCFEVIVRLTIYTAFSPIIIYCYLYKPTRPIFDNAVKGYIYTVMMFSILGVFIAAALLIAQICTNAVQGFASNISSAMTNSTAFANAISYAGVAIVTGMMVGRVMASASTAAAAMASYAYANLGVAAGAMSSISTAKNTLIGAAGVGLTLAVQGAGVSSGLIRRLLVRGGFGQGAAGVIGTATTVGAGGLIAYLFGQFSQGGGGNAGVLPNDPNPPATPPTPTRLPGR